jgi:plasmid stabilization system protein ParE
LPRPQQHCCTATLILYRLIPEGVQIVRVLHGARDIDHALYLEGIE